MKKYKTEKWKLMLLFMWVINLYGIFFTISRAEPPLAVVQPYVATLALTCPGRGLIRFVNSEWNFFPSQPCSICQERGQVLRFSVVGGSIDHGEQNGLMSDAGTVCMHNIEFNGRCFFSDDCFPFVAGRDYISIDLNQYINGMDLCRQGFY